MENIPTHSFVLTEHNNVFRRSMAGLHPVTPNPQQLLGLWIRSRILDPNKICGAGSRRDKSKTTTEQREVNWKKL